MMDWLVLTSMMRLFAVAVLVVDMATDPLEFVQRQCPFHRERDDGKRAVDTVDSRWAEGA